MAELVGAPIELAVIEFPGSRFNGAIVPALAELVERRVVRVLDLVLVCREVDGSTTSIELADLGDEDAATFDELEGEVGGLLSAEDVDQVGEALSLGSTAALIVWENTWAAHLLDAVADAGGRVVAHDRLDAQTVREAMADQPG